MKTALITGASRGIGNAIALHLKKEGYHVLGTATSSAGASKVVGQKGHGSSGTRKKIWTVIPGRPIKKAGDETLLRQNRKKNRRKKKKKPVMPIKRRDHSASSTVPPRPNTET